MKYAKTSEVKLDSTPSTIAWNCNGSLLAISTGTIYDLHKMQLTLDTTITPGTPCFSSQNPYLLATILNTELKIWNIETRSTKVETFGVVKAERVKWSWDDKYLLLMDGNMVHVVENGKIIYQIEGLDAAYNYNSLLLISTKHGSVQIYNNNKSMVHEWFAHPSPLVSLTLCPKGRYIYTTSNGALSLKWDTSTLLPIQSFETRDVEKVCVDSSGMNLALLGKNRFEIVGQMEKSVDGLTMEWNPRYECYAYIKKQRLNLCY